ncbi:hypothetical protein ORI89_06875 [Sphingobacterium sp. UT-1RO-CII-1]|uniref:hypothetical protein n=1 Tax=Sphingobacterium sp. UT-1RO-CII-1 TaxID=2995225 RepID=UPI00227AB3E3|nr:hypothetical protein [Sphingobacterium sp. UT-1RO-CII-1]MCY4779366.1 hypothetical protein [Sphingobacterium sp. UT-1RO-CII-1]
MIEVEHIVSVRKPEKPDVVMARMDYVIICQVIERLNEIGMSDDELSFLLGKPNNYVFGFIVKPNDKNRFHEDQIDLLPYLLDCPFSRILINSTPPGDIHLHYTKKIKEEGYKGFSHIIYDMNGDGTRIIWKKKQAPKGTTRKTNEPLLALLKQWIADGYFDQKQNALEIYKKLKAENVELHISELEKCLKILCRANQQLLEKDAVDGVLKYWKLHKK